MEDAGASGEQCPTQEHWRQRQCQIPSLEGQGVIPKGAGVGLLTQLSVSQQVAKHFALLWGNYNPRLWNRHQSTPLPLLRILEQM